MTEQGLPENDPRDDDEVETAPDETDEQTDEEGTGPDVKTDVPAEPTPDQLPAEDQPEA